MADIADRPEPEGFTVREGGAWIKWKHRHNYNDPEKGLVFHSIRFTDGSAFDMYNGWRPRKYPTPWGEENGDDRGSDGA